MEAFCLSDLILLMDALNWQAMLSYCIWKKRENLGCKYVYKFDITTSYIFRHLICLILHNKKERNHYKCDLYYLLYILVIDNLLWYKFTKKYNKMRFKQNLCFCTFYTKISKYQTINSLKYIFKLSTRILGHVYQLDQILKWITNEK